MFLIAILVLILIAAYFSHASKKPMRKAVENINGPFCWPVIGAVQIIFKMDPKNFLQRSYEFGLKYGRIIRIWAFNRLVVVSADMELNEQILASQQHIVKQRNYKILHQWLGVGLLMSDGKKWFSRRKIITPAFHFQILEQFVKVFDRQSSIFINRLAEKADGQTTFDVYPYVCLAALDIIAETSMGTKINAQIDANNKYTAAVNEMTKLMAWRFLKIHLNNEFIFSIMYPHLKIRQTRLIKIMHDFTTNVIEERRRVLEKELQAKSEQMEQNSDEDDEHNIGGSKKRMALLDILLQSTIDGKPLSNEDIREEVDTFMFEGHDTTTSAICFALHQIARHADVQSKLYAEVVHILGDKPKKDLVTLNNLNEMKYMECVIKETLRLYPPVPIIGREFETDFQYTHSVIGDGRIPAGTEFLIIIHGMMRDPDRFVDPEVFKPERHENYQSAGAYSLIPFSAGPRNCIGQKFAMLEMKTMISKVLLNYELLPMGEDVWLELNIVLRSSTGFQIGLKKRFS